MQWSAMITGAGLRQMRQLFNEEILLSRALLWRAAYALERTVIGTLNFRF